MKLGAVYPLSSLAKKQTLWSELASEVEDVHVAAAVRKCKDELKVLIVDCTILISDSIIILRNLRMKNVILYIFVKCFIYIYYMKPFKEFITISN
jgi:hypothetical protein